MRVGVLGGTFDPVHFGHIMLAEQVAAYLGLPKVVFIPANLPPHKEIERVAPIGHRIEMLKLAICGNGIFEVSTIECDREGKSYSYKTMEVLREIYPKGTEFHFIIGSDVLFDLTTFKNIDVLSKMCIFAAAIRPGADRAALSRVAEGLRENYGARVCLVPFDEVDISSTQVKGMIESNECLEGTLPGAVIDYISSKGLYKRKKGAASLSSSFL